MSREIQNQTIKELLSVCQSDFGLFEASSYPNRSFIRHLFSPKVGKTRIIGFVLIKRKSSAMGVCGSLNVFYQSRVFGLITLNRAGYKVSGLSLNLLALFLLKS
jgi:hypothetical protein